MCLPQCWCRFLFEYTVRTRGTFVWSRFTCSMCSHFINCAFLPISFKGQEWPGVPCAMCYIQQPPELLHQGHSELWCHPSPCLSDKLTQKITRTNNHHVFTFPLFCTLLLVSLLLIWPAFEFTMPLALCIWLTWHYSVQLLGACMQFHVHSFYNFITCLTVSFCFNSITWQNLKEYEEISSIISLRGWCHWWFNSH